MDPALLDLPGPMSDWPVLWGLLATGWGGAVAILVGARRRARPRPGLPNLDLRRSRTGRDGRPGAPGRRVGEAIDDRLDGLEERVDFLERHLDSQPSEALERRHRDGRGSGAASASRREASERSGARRHVSC